jgi:hypothetical protein
MELSKMEDDSEDEKSNIEIKDLFEEDLIDQNK